MRAFLPHAAALILAGCGSQETSHQQPASPPETEFEQHWPGHIAASDEFRIQATFPGDRPVCVSDSGTHIHGFHQWRDGDCGDEADASGNFISVYADYNAAFFDWDEAAAGYCGADTEPFDLGMSATGTGRFSACIPKVCGEQYVITAVYLADLPGTPLGDEPAHGGPDLIYTIALGTSPETEDEDLEIFRNFLADLQLAGGTFGPA